MLGGLLNRATKDMVKLPVSNLTTSSWCCSPICQFEYSKRQKNSQRIELRRELGGGGGGGGEGGEGLLSIFHQCFRPQDFLNVGPQ